MAAINEIEDLGSMERDFSEVHVACISFLFTRGFGISIFGFSLALLSFSLFSSFPFFDVAFRFALFGFLASVVLFLFTFSHFHLVERVVHNFLFLYLSMPLRIVFFSSV